MGRYLKSYKRYPAGSLIVSKRYSLFSRLKWIFKKGHKPYNHISILPKDSHIGLSKFDKLRYDYHIFIPKEPYKHTELVKLRNLLKSCSTTEDYLVAINIVRPGSVDVTNLDNLRNNTLYRKIYLEQEPFQDVNYDTKEK